MRAEIYDPATGLTTGQTVQLVFNQYTRDSEISPEIGKYLNIHGWGLNRKRWYLVDVKTGIGIFTLHLSDWHAFNKKVGA